MISGIQFHTIQLLITETVEIDKFIKVHMMQKVNTIKEVELKLHNLTANLSLNEKTMLIRFNKLVQMH